MNAAAFALSPQSLNSVSFVQALTSELLSLKRSDPKRLEYLNDFRAHLASDPSLLAAAEAGLPANPKFTVQFARVSEFPTFGWDSNISGFLAQAAAAAAAAAADNAW